MSEYEVVFAVLIVIVFNPLVKVEFVARSILNPVSLMQLSVHERATVVVVCDPDANDEGAPSSTRRTGSLLVASFEFRSMRALVVLDAFRAKETAV